MRKRGGLELFGGEVNGMVLDEILRWRSHPELRQIVLALEAHTNRKAFYDTYAEAMVGRHLLARGCQLRFEVPTPAGRRADFEVRLGAQTFFLHVKQIDTDRPRERTLRISSRLRSLEKIKRPYVVQVRWIEDATLEQMQRLVTLAGEFILHARIGDEMTARDHDGREIGGVRIIAPVPGSGAAGHPSHVQLAIGLPMGFIDAAPRIRRLMHRAYQQFMPRATNVILICTSHLDDVDDFETALLGRHIERWDAFPPRGRRIAHGRAVDGLWAGHRFPESRFAGWFCFAPRDAEAVSRLWVRAGVAVDARMREVLRSVIEGGSR